MKVLINFADQKYRHQQLLNTATGKSIGGFDSVIEFGPNDLDNAFLEENKRILSNRRGAGLWLWKPYLILKAFEKISENDYLFYCDSGSYFINPIDPLINCLNKNNLDIMLFDCPMTNLQFSKKSLVELLGLDKNEWLFRNQTIASFILLKKTPNSYKFIQEYLELCKKPELLEDPLETDLQHRLFIAHRHDQTILSFLSWKHKIETFRDPSQYGFLPLEYVKYSLAQIGEALANHKTHKISDYPTIIHHSRNRNVAKRHQRGLLKLSIFIKTFLSKKITG